MGKVIPKTVRITCERCKAELEVTKSDLVRDTMYPSVWKCVCPCCNNKLFLQHPEIFR